MEKPIIPKKKRPLGIRIIAILLILSGTINFAGLSMTIATCSSIGAPLPIRTVILSISFGIVCWVSGFGLLKLKKWAWWLATVFMVLDIVRSSVDFVTSVPFYISYDIMTRAILTYAIVILIDVIILTYLLMPRTKAVFR